MELERRVDIDQECGEKEKENENEKENEKEKEKEKKKENDMWTDEVRTHLEIHGWAVVKNVLDSDAVDRFQKGVANYFVTWDHALTPDNPRAWTTTRLLPGTMNGVDKWSGHTHFMWDVRQDPRVVRLFAGIFDTPAESMRTSFDGFGFYLAAAPRKPMQARGNWGHFDHGTSQKTYRCVQAAVCMSDCEREEDGGFVVWDKSHRVHDGYFVRHGLTCPVDGHIFPYASDSDTYGKLRRQPFLDEIERDARPYLQTTDPEYGVPGPVPMRRTRISARAGDVVVWYSDTAHQNQPPTPAGRDRLVAYVSMVPVAHITKREFAVRQRAFVEQKTTNHWAAQGFRTNTVRLYTAAKTNTFKRRFAEFCTKLPPRNLTLLGQTIAGLHDTANSRLPAGNITDSSSARKRKRNNAPKRINHRVVEPHNKKKVQTLVPSFFPNCT